VRGRAFVGWYRRLKSEARRRGSIAAVVRGLIEAARARQRDASRDPLIQHLLCEPSERGKEQTTVQTLDDDLYGR
jgi:hypothetical protein